jgi:NAD(P)H-flavin reductase
MVKSGVRPSILLHGAHSADDLYYRSLLSRSAGTYIACLSSGGSGAFHGTVTDHLAEHLPPARYDFYLCGNRRMIRDATLLADDRFPGARVFTEAFY